MRDAPSSPAPVPPDRDVRLVALGALRVTIGALLLLFGLEWLRKGTLRLAGRRSRSSSLNDVALALATTSQLPSHWLARTPACI